MAKNCMDGSKTQRQPGHINPKKHGSVKSHMFNKQLNNVVYYIPSSEILEFPSLINFDIITSDDINFHFHFLP